MPKVTMDPASAASRPARQVARNCGTSRMMWSAASASTTALGSRLAAPAVAAVLAGELMEMRAGDDDGGPEHRVLHAEEGFLIGRAVADQGQELLGQGVARDRPKAGPGAPGQQDGNDRRGHGFRVRSIQIESIPSLTFCLCMIFSGNRLPSPIGVEDKLFGDHARARLVRALCSGRESS